MTEPLVDQKCVACRPDAERASDAQCIEWGEQIPDWQRIEVDGIARLERIFLLDGYGAAVQLTDRIAELAEELDHHPAILLEWGKVTVQWWTHKIGGLHKNDFIAAARTDLLAQAG
ncbi:MAG: 4a-hydroxytetrahydrobiopterin dehydratase [Gammaproteobacteria bacterium AqS3]|nr:4a-hydroxytetrahydrobiopterin dehydratase [Gammaproteobacteria bacterium AqS3]